MPDAVTGPTEVDGKWYNSAGVEARDCAAQLQAWIDAVSAVKGSGELDAGNWYLKNAPTGPQREFVVAKSNVTLYGHGEESTIRLGPGLIATGTGYGAVIGNLDIDNPANAVNNFYVRDIAFDHNSAHNKFPAPNWGGMGSFGAKNYAIGIWQGDSVAYERITIRNHNGIFALGFGQYGRPDLATNGRIKTIRGYGLHNDSNSGDSSKIAVGATNFTVDDVVGVGVALSGNGNVATLCELHGFHWTATNIQAIDMGRALNIAGDNNDSTDFTVSGVRVARCFASITLYSGFGRKLARFDIGNVSGTIRPSLGGELGLSVALNSALGWPDGLGFFDWRLHDVDLTLDGTTGGGGESTGVRIAANTGDGINGGGGEIYNITCRGFATAALVIAPQNQVNIGAVSAATFDGTTNRVTFASGTPNNYSAFRFSTSGALPTGLTPGTTYWLVNKVGNTYQLSASVAQGDPVAGGNVIDFTGSGSGAHTATQVASNIVRDLHVHHVRGENCGQYGLIVSTNPAEAANVFLGLKVDHVYASDTRTSPVLIAPCWITAAYDDRCSFDSIDGHGHSGSVLAFDLSGFPTKVRRQRWDDNTIDIRNFGAVPGEQNSLGSIQAAIDYAATHAVREVYVPGGYSVAGAIIGRSSVTLVGDSTGASSITQLIPGSRTYVATDCSDHGMRRIKLLGSSGENVIHNKSSTVESSHFTLDEVSIVGFGSPGIGVTVDIGTDTFTAVNHGLFNGHIVQLSSVIGGHLVALMFSAANDRVTLNGHGLLANDPVQFNDYNIGMPGGVPSRTTVYVKTVVDANTFTLSLAPGGALLDITSAGQPVITAWGVLPAPLDPQLEYFVVNKTDNTFQLALTSGGAAINLTAAGSTPLKVARVFAAVYLECAGRNQYSPRLRDVFIDGVALGDGGARHGIRCETTTSGIPVHVSVVGGEIAHVKRALNTLSGETWAMGVHIYNVLDGCGGGVVSYANGYTAIRAIHMRLESAQAIERVIKWGASTFGCLFEGSKIAQAYMVSLATTNQNSVDVSTSGSLANLHGGFNTFQALVQDAISELTSGHGVQIMSALLKAADAAFSGDIHANSAGLAAAQSRLGAYVSNPAFAALYLGIAAGAELATNFALQSGGTNLTINAPGAAGTIDFYRATAQNLATLTGSIADTETALLVRRNAGGTQTVERVSMGAVDSGGWGFKVLRVPN